MTNTITIKSNYFATTNEGRITYEGPFPGNIGGRVYGPLELKPYCGLIVLRLVVVCEVFLPVRVRQGFGGGNELLNTRIIMFMKKKHN